MAETKTPETKPDQLPLDYRFGFEEALTSMLVVTSPYSATYMFYANLVTQCAVNFSTQIATAGVHFNKTHYVLTINPNFFNPLPLEQRCGILKHEMIHILNGHLIRLEDRESFKKWNYAADCALNQFIDRKHLPSGAIYPDNLPVLKGKKAKDKVNAEQYYDIIDDDQIDCNGKGPNGQGTIDDHSQWEKSEGANEDLQKDIAKNMMEKAANETAKGRGNLPSEYSDWLDLNSYKRQVDWRRVLRGICGNKRVNSRRTIMRQDRRFPRREDLRGKTKDRMFNLLLVGDESGSVSDIELSEGIAEILHICDVTKSELDYIAIDTEPHPPVKIKKTQRTFERQACGGTNLNPALDMAKKHNIDYQAVVVITDGGLYPSDVEAFRKIGKKVIWLITSNGISLPEMSEGLMSCYKLQNTNL